MVVANAAAPTPKPITATNNKSNATLTPEEIIR